MDDKNKNLEEMSDDIEDIKSRYKTEAEEIAEYEEKGPADISGYTLGLNLLVSILVCTGLGYIAEKFFASNGLLLAAFIIFGFAAGIWQIWKKMNENE